MSANIITDYATRTKNRHGVLESVQAKNKCYNLDHP